ncbi:hypothetical protein Tco_1118699 [Tanacetum coccineum]
MASMNTRLNIEKLDGNIVQKQWWFKQVGYGAQGDSEAEEQKRNIRLGVDGRSEGNILDSCIGVSQYILVCPRNMSFNECWEYKKTFIGSGVGTFQVKARLKDDMPFARSDVLIHIEKLVQTLLKEHSILSLEDSLSGDCDVEKNVCAYRFCVDFDIRLLVRSITRYGFMIQGLVKGSVKLLSCTLDGFVNKCSGVYDTYGGCKGGYLAKETRNRVRIRAKDSSGYCYMCLVKACTSPASRE